MTGPDHGYSIHGQVFQRMDMLRVLGALGAADVDRTRAGARHVLKVPEVRELSSDPRLITIAQQHVGPTAVAFRATLFDKSPNANWLVVWHQDTALPIRRHIDDPAWGPWSTKAGVLQAHAPAWALENIIALRISLDDSTNTNGPLRVLPDTHLEGVLSDVEINQRVRDTTPVACVAVSGGVVAMRPLTIHASSKANDDHPRRVLHIEYAATMDLGAGVELAAG